MAFLSKTEFIPVWTFTVLGVILGFSTCVFINRAVSKQNGRDFSIIGWICMTVGTGAYACLTSMFVFNPVMYSIPLVFCIILLVLNQQGGETMSAWFSWGSLWTIMLAFSIAPLMSQSTWWGAFIALPVIAFLAGGIRTHVLNYSVEDEETDDDENEGAHMMTYFFQGIIIIVLVAGIVTCLVLALK